MKKGFIHLLSEIKEEILEKRDDIEENIEHFKETLEKEVSFHSKNWKEKKPEIQSKLNKESLTPKLKEEVNHLLISIRNNTNRIFDDVKSKIAQKRS